MITLSGAHDDDDVSSIYYGKGSRVVEGLQNFWSSTNFWFGTQIKAHSISCKMIVNLMLIRNCLLQ